LHFSLNRFSRVWHPIVSRHFLGFRSFTFDQLRVMCFISAPCMVFATTFNLFPGISKIDAQLKTQYPKYI
jgi:hypothetical protein